MPANSPGVALELVRGGIDFLSGSGATVDFLAEHAMRRGLKFNSFLTVGNSAQSGVPEVMEIYDAEHTADSPKDHDPVPGKHQSIRRNS